MGTHQSHKRSLAFACGIALAGTLGLGACSTYEAAHPGNPISQAHNLDDARQALVAALDGGARARFPSLAARSQALYDCWVERSENDVSTAFNGQCRRGFVRDYTDLIVLLDPPAPRDVYFAFNSATLTPEGEQQIKEAVAQIEEGTAHLAIVGKADRSGSNAYNMKLSEERAKAVSEAAVADGLSANRISVTAVGETQPPVSTKDGAREPRNRLVEIETVLPAAQVADLSPQ